MIRYISLNEVYYKITLYSLFKRYSSKIRYNKSNKKSNHRVKQIKRNSIFLCIEF